MWKQAHMSFAHGQTSPYCSSSSERKVRMVLVISSPWMVISRSNRETWAVRNKHIIRITNSSYHGPGHHLVGHEDTDLQIFEAHAPDLWAVLLANSNHIPGPIKLQLVIPPMPNQPATLWYTNTQHLDQHSSIALHVCACLCVYVYIYTYIIYECICIYLVLDVYVCIYIYYIVHIRRDVDMKDTCWIICVCFATETPQSTWFMSSKGTRLCLQKHKKCITCVHVAT